MRKARKRTKDGPGTGAYVVGRGWPWDVARLPVVGGVPPDETVFGQLELEAAHRAGAVAAVPPLAFANWLR
jgi:hypothetical protein